MNVPRDPVPNFFGSLIPPFDDPAVAILPVAYEGTVSYESGTSAGPRAILTASAQLELYEMEMDCEPVMQYGLTTLDQLTLDALQPADAAAAVAEAVAQLFGNHKLLVLLGGEHAITAAAYEGFKRKHAGPVTLVQIDSHADLRDSFRGTPYSHGSMARRVHEAGVEQIIQLGIRSLCQEEADFLRAHCESVHIFDAAMLHADFDCCIAQLGRMLVGRTVYLTLDVDGLDPGIIPATGTPEPGGLGWWQTLAILRAVCGAAHVPIFDCVELAPRPGLHAADFAAAKLVYKTMNYIMMR